MKVKTQRQVRWTATQPHSTLKSGMKVKTNIKSGRGSFGGGG